MTILLIPVDEPDQSVELAFRRAKHFNGSVWLTGSIMKGEIFRSLSIRRRLQIPETIDLVLSKVPFLP